MVFILSLLVILVLIFCFYLKAQLDEFKETVSKTSTELYHRISKLELNQADVKQKENITEEQNTQKQDTEDAVVHYDSILGEVKPKSNFDNQDVFENLTLAQNKIKENILSEQEDVNNSTKDKPADVVIKEETDLIGIVLGGIFDKIGAIALVLGIVFFVILANEFIEFTPQFVVSCALVFSLGLIVKSLYSFKEQNVQPIAHALCGVGIAGTLASVFAGYSLYSIFPMNITIFISCLLVLGSYIIAVVNNSFSTMLIGLIGAYMVPIFINADISTSALYVYFLFVNIITLVYMYFNPNRNVLNIVNITLSSIFIFAKGDLDSLSVVFPLIFWLIYFANDLVLILKGKYEKSLEMTNWLNFFVLLVFSRSTIGENDNIGFGLFILLMSSIYLIVQLLILRKNREFLPRIYMQNALCALYITSFFLCNQFFKPCVWGVEGCLLVLLYKKYRFIELKKFALTMLSSSFVFIFFTGDIVYNISKHYNYTSERLVLFLVPFASLLFTSGILKDIDKKISELTKYLALSLAYIFVGLNLTYHFSANPCFAYICILLLLVYSLNLKLMSKDWSKEFIGSTSSLLYVFALIIYAIALMVGFNSLDDNVLPFMNFKFITGLAIIAASIYRAIIDNSELHKYIAIYTGALCLSAELFLLFNIYGFENANIAISIFLVLYSSLFMLLGIFKKIKYFIVSGLLLVLLSMFKIIVFDLLGSDLIVKFLVFLILGACLIFVSYYYKKLSD